MVFQRRPIQIYALLVILCSFLQLSCAFVAVRTHYPSKSKQCTFTKVPFRRPPRRSHQSQRYENVSLQQRQRGRSLFMTTNKKSDGKRTLATCMAFLCGWADVALFARYKTFATMMTGNVLWMSVAAAEQRYRDTLFYLSVICSYLGGLVVFRKTDLRLKQRTMPVAAVLVSTLFCASDYVYCLSGGAAQWLPMLMLASAYGIINSVGTEMAGTLVFVVTGHMTKLTNVAVDRLSSLRKQKQLTVTERNAVKENAAVVLGFIGGALCASVLRQTVKRVAEFALLGILYGILFLLQDMEAIGGAWWLRNRFCDEVDDDGSMCDVDDDEENIGSEVGNSTAVRGRSGGQVIS